jgi:tetratricopeptide (TPR) repeat protein
MSVQIFLINLLLLSSLTLKGSTEHEADSLKSVVFAMPNDSNKIKALNDIAFEYRNFNPNETIELAKKALALGEKIDQKWDLSRSLNFIGVGHQKLGEQALALEYYRKAKDCALKTKNIEQLAYSYHNMGTVYNWQNNYVKSIELFGSWANLVE